MSHQSALHPISLQYPVRTSQQGYREVERLPPLLSELQNAAIRHRRILAKAGVPNKEILRLQNAGITELRGHDPDFANISRRLAASVVKRVNNAYHRAYTVPNAGFPRTESPYGFRTLEIYRAASTARQVPEIGCRRDPHQGLPNPVFQDRPPHQLLGTT